MKNIIITAILAGTLGLSACSFQGVATNSGETYTTSYNLPGEKISPYNNPASDNKVDEEKIKVCQGNPDKKGFKCNK